MIEHAMGTMARASKGPVIPPPALKGILATVAEAVSSWPGVITTGHWSLFKPRRVDGIDFYVGEEELGHIHLDGDIHLATSPRLGSFLSDGGLARPFQYIEGWIHEEVQKIGSRAAVALFRSKYERLVGPPSSAPINM